jgi:hypothetical protein
VKPVVEHAGSKILEMSQPMVEHAIPMLKTVRDTAQPVVEHAGSKILAIGQPAVGQAKRTIGNYATNASKSAKPAVEKAGEHILTMGKKVQSYLNELQAQPHNFINKEQMDIVFQAAIQFGEQAVSYVPEVANQVVVGFQKMQSEQKFDIDSLRKGVEHLVEVVRSLVNQTTEGEQPETEAKAEQPETEAKPEQENPSEHNLEKQAKQSEAETEINANLSDPEIEPEKQDEQSELEQKPENTELQSVDEDVALQEPESQSQSEPPDSVEVKQEPELDQAEKVRAVDVKQDPELYQAEPVIEGEPVIIEGDDEWENIGDWESSKWELVPPEYAVQIAQLREMGCEDLEKMISLLKHNKGNLQATCNALFQ